MRHRLGKPLPHQQADTPRADPGPPELCPTTHASYRGYPVLATVSRCYPRVQGTLPTCYSPVRRFQPEPLRVLVSSLDLHVLSTPPAFVLSQDQTLRKDFSTRKCQKFDAVQRTPTIRRIKGVCRIYSWSFIDLKDRRVSADLRSTHFKWHRSELFGRHTIQFSRSELLFGQEKRRPIDRQSPRNLGHKGSGTYKQLRSQSGARTGREPTSNCLVQPT
jgi:hypothetical protein